MTARQNLLGAARSQNMTLIIITLNVKFCERNVQLIQLHCVWNMKQILQCCGCNLSSSAVSNGGDTRSTNLYQKLATMHVTKTVWFELSAAFESFW